MKRFLCWSLALCMVFSALLFFPIPSKGESTAQTSVTDKVLRILVLGCDRASGLCDTMFIVSVRKSDGRACILQIPRDTYANYTQKSYKKLNGALFSMGAKGVKDFLAESFGVPIDFFAVLDLDAFTEAVDAVGGVDVDIPREMVYSDPAQSLDIHLPAGRVHLNGEMAEQFVRYRSGYVNADLGRLDAQKIFLQAFAQKCGELSSVRLFGVALCMMTRLSTDIGVQHLSDVIGTLRACQGEQIPMATLAGQAVKGNSGAWYYVINRRGACDMINEYLMPTTPLTVEAFDPHGVFDRAQNPNFHNVYQADAQALPLDPP